jgi:hypothetical protein
MRKLSLIHPIYLDVPMLMSFAAAVQGGISLESEITRDRTKTTEISGQADGGFNAGPLFKVVADASASLQGAGRNESGIQESRKEFRSYTEASIAILLYDGLKANKSIVEINKITDIQKVDSGSLVEISGVAHRNSVDAIIDYIDTLLNFGRINDSLKRNQGSTFQAGSKSKGEHPKNQDSTRMYKNVCEILKQDRDRTPISNLILKCLRPNEMSAVLTMRRENLRDLTFSEINRNTVRVVGKVTRLIGEDEKMSSFENYGFSLLSIESLDQLFSEVATKMAGSGVYVDFVNPSIKGPALQILPLMVFV